MCGEVWTSENVLYYYSGLEGMLLSFGTYMSLRHGPADKRLSIRAHNTKIDILVGDPPSPAVYLRPRRNDSITLRRKTIWETSGHLSRIEKN